MKRVLKTLVVLLALCLVGLITIFGLFFIISLDLPQINSLKDYNPPMNSKILSKNGEILLEIGAETRDVVSYEKIPKRVIEAFLSAEDDNFFNHSGVDYLGIARAFVVNLKEGRLVQGGSTITQQVAKSFLLTKERTISRKVKDLLLARKIEQKFTKEEILYLYLNQVYLGGGYYGIKAAFRGYFDKSLEDATAAECALVAGLLVAPGRYSPYVNPQFAKVRQNYVLKRMYDTGKITKDEYEGALSENIKMRIRVPNEMKGGHFTDWIRQEVMNMVGSDQFLTNGFVVTTTLDWSLQKRAEDAVKSKVKELDKRQGYKGPIKTLVKEEIQQFLKDQRAKILKEQSSYFTFTTDGKAVYEFNEEESALEKTTEYLENEKSKLNVRFKSLVDVGNFSLDKFNKFLKVGKTYQAVVVEVNDLKRIIVAETGGARIIVPESGFEWAHERKFGEEPVYHSPQKTPSEIVKRGDVIWVNIQKEQVSLSEVIHPNFFKKYNDKGLKKILDTQMFLLASLDQEPEVEGALIALNSGTGEIISLVGGSDFKKSQFNRVLQSARQPGSAVKPFIYAAALEHGYNPSSILMDTPQSLGGVDDSLRWKPRNYDGDFKGPMTLRNALEVSRNIPPIRLVQDLGVDKIHEIVKRFHINTELPVDMSLSLGSFGISLAELTKAYAIFPNGGRALRLKAISSIKDRDGKTYNPPPADLPWQTGQTANIPSTEPNGENSTSVTNPFLASLNSVQVYDPRLAYIMTNLLKGVVHYGTGSQAAKLSPNLGGKTGTTNNYVDALFVGFSNEIAVGAWTGFDDNRTLGYGETGGKAALPMWMDFMESAIAKYGAGEFKIPEGISNILVNKETGKPIAAGATDGFLESFVEGFDPSSGPVMVDQNPQENPDTSPTINDDDYYLNQ